MTPGLQKFGGLSKLFWAYSIWTFFEYYYIYYRDANFNKLKFGFKGYLKSLLCLKSTIFVEILILSKYGMNANIMK